jgi:MFS family permease
MNSWSASADMGSSGDDELRLIPLWSIILAILLFAAMQVVQHVLLPHKKPEYFPLRLMMGYFWGMLVASYALLLGYVSCDVKRRGMSAGLWMLVCVILPCGIGAVVYFMLRQPVLTRCPNCTTSIAVGYRFCPQCQFQIAPVCGVCHRSVEITDVFCTQCGHDLAEDGAPARLRVYSDR